MPMEIKTAEERFWAKVDKSGECWPWTAHCNSTGYGQFWDGTYRTSGAPHNVGAHRWIFEQTAGPLAPGVCILHRCDNPPCVNPAHLFAGSHRDNAIDRENKGRGAHNLQVKRGEANGSAKLTWPEVQRMRSLNAQGWSQSQLAREFGVSTGLVNAIVREKLWREAS